MCLVMQQTRGCVRLCLVLLLSCSFTASAVPQGIHIYDERAEAPQLELIDIAGHAHSLEAYAGRVVVVNFWATWCVPCKKEMPSLERLHVSLQDKGLLVLAIAASDSEDDVRAYQTRTPLVFPLLADETQRITERWSVLAVPTTYVVDRQGKIALRVTGEYDWQGTDIVAHVRRLILMDTLKSMLKGFAVSFRKGCADCALQNTLMGRTVPHLDFNRFLVDYGLPRKTVISSWSVELPSPADFHFVLVHFDKAGLSTCQWAGSFNLFIECPCIRS